jgi:hypothetical protein
MQPVTKIVLAALAAGSYAALLAGRTDIVRFREMRRMSGSH